MSARSAVARTIRDATRFTSTTPHAAVAGRLSPSSSASPASSSVARAVFSSSPPPPRPGKATRIPGETPEERVARLRRAHDAARNAQVSTVDKVIIAGRDLADKAHRITVMFLMGFSAICFLFTVFAVYDMVRFNRRRRREFEEQVSKFEAGSLNEARLAYITGNATEDQITMVEAANKLAEEMGQKLPPLLERPSEGTLAEAAFGQTHENEQGGAAVAAEKRDMDTMAMPHEVAKVEEKMEAPAQKKVWWKVW